LDGVTLRKKPVPPKGIGRQRGSRNRLQATVYDIAAASAEKHGAAALDQVRRENPGLYLKVLVSLVPRELEITHGVDLGAMTAEEVADALQVIRQLRGRAINGIVDLTTPTLELVANGSGKN
jgi:hypothetical protein